MTKETKEERKKDRDYTISVTKSERDKIHKMRGVTGSGITHSDITKIGKGHQVVIYVENKSVIPSLPTQINGVLTTYKVTGKIKPALLSRKLNQQVSTQSLAFTSTYRPLQGGSSIGDVNTLSIGYETAGTLGGFPISLDTGTYVILSNNHVIANDNPGARIAKTGDATIQPGTIDGGTLTNTVGNLFKVIPILDAGTGNNIVDCAYSITSIPILQTSLCNQHINPTIQPEIGMTISKAGRTTQCTTGTINAVNVTLNVDYSFTTTPHYATFVDQIQTSDNFILAGDSGSVAIDNSTSRAVGLVFAGADNNCAFMNTMTNVENQLGVSFSTSQCASNPSVTLNIP